MSLSRREFLERSAALSAAGFMPRLPDAWPVAPEPLSPDESGINPRQPGTSGDFGRRLIVRSFRWLNPGEV